MVNDMKVSSSETTQPDVAQHFTNPWVWRRLSLVRNGIVAAAFTASIGAGCTGESDLADTATATEVTSSTTLKPRPTTTIETTTTNSITQRPTATETVVPANATKYSELEQLSPDLKKLRDYINQHPNDPELQLLKVGSEACKYIMKYDYTPASSENTARMRSVMIHYFGQVYEDVRSTVDGADYPEFYDMVDEECPRNMEGGGPAG